jgi:LmbE family N-acetylglucosaminyl deacetylase
MSTHSRRHFLTASVPLTLGAAIGLKGSVSGHDSRSDPGNKMKILVAGAHPDDPETMCGGLMALYAEAGHEVVSAYLTRGEAGIEGKSFDESAQIRTAEAKSACETLHVRPEFLGQIDGSCEITRERYGQMADFIKKERPDIIITHWPIDTHRDHRICSVLVYDTWLRLDYPCALYYGEVMTGIQSQNFSPTEYVDISSVAGIKHKACFAHVSQKIEESYPNDHGRMEIFRGMESGCAYAEAFVRQIKHHGIL